MASLFIIRGADQGKRFELKAKVVGLGRDNSNPIRLHDTEVSRRHAEVRRVDDTFRLVDLASANGTYLNDAPVDQVPMKSGDQIRIGQTVLLFQDSIAEAGKELTARVDMLGLASPEDRSAILRSIPVGEGSRILQTPGNVGDWLKDRLLNLSVMYKATQAISHVVEIDTLLPQILQLVFESIGADRGAILLKGPDGELEPKAVRWRGPAGRGRADVDLADDHRPRPRQGGGRHHLRTPPPTHGSARRSRSSTSASARRSASRSRGDTPPSASSTPTSAPRPRSASPTQASRTAPSSGSPTTT